MDTGNSDRIPSADAKDAGDDWGRRGSRSAWQLQSAHYTHSQSWLCMHGPGKGLAVNVMSELVVGSILWVGIVVGLVYVVRDCMKERDQDPIFMDDEEEECQVCGGQGCVEILHNECEES